MVAEIKTETCIRHFTSNKGIVKNNAYIGIGLSINVLTIEFNKCNLYIFYQIKFVLYLNYNL